MRLFLALRVFFRTLLNSSFSQEQQKLLAAEPTAEPVGLPAPQAPASKAKPATTTKTPQRSEAITLLAALQREGRLVDFLMESLDDYSDDQIGAAVRDVHRDCKEVLNRMFDLRPAASQEEGQTVELAEGFDPGRYQLVGNLTEGQAVHGTLVHRGWQATQTEVPLWTGTEASAKIVAPIQLEIF